MTTHLRLTEGVFIGSHAVSEGLVPRQDLRRRHRRIVQGVYATRGLPYDHDTRCRGAMLVLPPTYAIGGLSAVGWYADPMLGPQDSVTVVGPDGPTWRGPAEIRPHRSDLVPDDVITDVRGVRVTDPWRTAWDIATLEPVPTAVAALDRLGHAGAVDLPAFARWVQTRAGLWRVVRVREVLELTDARAESPPESRIRVLLVRAGLEPEVQYRVLDDRDEEIARVDLALSQLKIALEYEGAHHFDPDRMRQDEARLARLRAAGWIVLRLANSDLYDLDSVVDRVLALVEARTIEFAG